jgi:hypothetical protein
LVPVVLLPGLPPPSDEPVEPVVLSIPPVLDIVGLGDGDWVSRVAVAVPDALATVDVPPPPDPCDVEPLENALTSTVTKPINAVIIATHSAVFRSGLPFSKITSPPRSSRTVMQITPP